MSNLANDLRNKQLFLKQVPKGEAGPDDFELREAPLPEPGEGEVLVESHYLGVDAALRLIMRDSKDFLFRVAPGDLVRGGIAGKVVESRHPDFEPGDYVLAGIGCQSYGTAAGAELEKVDISQAPLSAWLGGFGVSGLTAFFAIYHECKPQPHHTVVINGAAGAVGSMAGQFAKLAGARVIGIAGSDEKCDWLVNELGFDAAVNYKEGDLYEKLQEVAPNRIDIIFDNVGGKVLDESLRLIAMHGFVLLCGSTSQYVADEMAGPSQYIWLGTMRARMQGFVVFDYAEHNATARQHMAEWIKSGKLKIPEEVFEGDIGDFPVAFQQLYQGGNKGKMVVKLPAAED